MTQRILTTALLGLVLSVSACHKKDPPIPGPTPGGGGTQTPPPAPQPPPPPGPVNNNPNTGTTATVDRTALAMSIADKIHFDFDQAVISTEDRAKLDLKARIMRANPTLKIRIIGHCDERGSDSYNITLGNRRAEAAKAYLVQAGIDGSRIDVTSLGRESPIDPAKTEEAWAKNRRDEFEITATPTAWVAPS